MYVIIYARLYVVLKQSYIILRKQIYSYLSHYIGIK